jgi:hypothetical protein
MLWGVEAQVIDRFGQAGIDKAAISFAKESFGFNFPCTSSEFVNIFRDYYGPTMNAFAAAEKEGRQSALQQELEVLFARENKNGSGNPVSITANYLRVTVLRTN